MHVGLRTGTPLRFTSDEELAKAENLEVEKEL
jgi:hypothetical protein